MELLSVLPWLQLLPLDLIAVVYDPLHLLRYLVVHLVVGVYPLLHLGAIQHAHLHCHLVLLLNCCELVEELLLLCKYGAEVLIVHVLLVEAQLCKIIISEARSSAQPRTYFCRMR